MSDTDRLLMIVPSRGRPRNIQCLADAFDATSADRADLLICIDDDDPEHDAYLALDIDDDIGIDSGPRLRLGGTLNKAASTDAGDYFAVGFCGDDHIFRSRAWDERFLDALHDLGSGIVYGNDLIQGPALPTAVAMTSDIVTTLGWMAPPGLVHLFLDDAWRDLGNAMGRLRYLPDVVIEHLHPIAGKAPTDAGYEEVNAPALYAADGAVYQNWREHGLPADIDKLRAAGLC